MIFKISKDFVRQGEASGKQAATLVKQAATLQSLSVSDFESHVKSCQIKPFSYTYYMHGLVEETGEVFEAVRAAQDAGAEAKKSHVMAIMQEVGDVLWYLQVGKVVTFLKQSKHLPFTQEFSPYTAASCNMKDSRGMNKSITIMVLP